MYIHSRWEIKTQNIVITDVESLFNKGNCDSTAIIALLGGHAGVTDNNILQYMGIIECNDVMNCYDYSHSFRLR